MMMTMLTMHKGESSIAWNLDCKVLPNPPYYDQIYIKIIRDRSKASIIIQHHYFLLLCSTAAVKYFLYHFIDCSKIILIIKYQSIVMYIPKLEKQTWQLSVETAWSHESGVTVTRLLLHRWKTLSSYYGSHDWGTGTYSRLGDQELGTLS